MNLIKITTNEETLVKKYMDDSMSFEKGIIEIIVGWDLAKSRGANILKHKIDKKTYWTFSPREKRKIFEEHIKSFGKEIIGEIINKITINNINPLTFNNVNDLIKHLKGSVRGCDGYLFNDRLYIYCGNTIYHLDMGLLNFLTWDISDHLEEIITLKEYQEKPNFFGGFDIKYIPYLNAKEDDIISNIC
jgi:hypothetical protein